MDPAPDRSLKILILEDEPTDAELVERTLRKAGLKIVVERTATGRGFAEALDKFKPDIILADYKLPDFDGLAAVKLVRKKDPELPVIAVSGFIGDQAAVELIRAGANDYVLKDRLARLPSAVQRAMAETEGRRERKRAEEALRESEVKLRESEAMYRSLVAAMAEGVVFQAASGDVIATNPAAARILGGPSERRLFGLKSDTVPWPCIREDGTPFPAESHPSMVTLRTGQPQQDVVMGLCQPDRAPTWISINSQPLLFAGETAPHAVVTTFHDITGRKQAERALHRLNRTLRTLSAADAAVVRATTEQELLDEMCRIGVEFGGYRLAWIGFVEHDEAKSIRPVAWAGEHPEFVQTANITWADTERGRGPTGTAIRTGEVQINQDVATNPNMLPWRADMLRYGFNACITLPLKNKSEVFGSVAFYASEQDAFGPEEVVLLKELAGDLAFGISARRDRAGHEAALSVVQENLKSTVQAIAAAVEMRDVYTAGHQRRVADLAVAIARAIGLTEEQIEGVFLAGLIHDVGKINVPAEILSKPGKLTPLEFQMVQTHAQTGYDIVKGIKFPWPVAQAILQHHERLDGSGYPNHLKGEDILIEAKILAVADVVDAMVSHRPYRAGLGLDAALAEIEAGKNRIYDPAAVDACVALFRQKGFKFS
ncbi:HD domain-containing phosphohydrolase [Bradyrhizobium sp. SZCCHNS1054]|uniref:HD domain-containing phosphohydrolase n=2 Tax=Bradyrhizobium TaxID=374 RepID=UPI002916DBD7|nr:HD domain-containing phosphohydrolase [Bradyrhizobium sp. SZCCHNS1054]